MKRSNRRKFIKMAAISGAGLSLANSFSTVYANVCEELHKYDIKFMDHYSCNNVERPHGETEFRRLHRIQRHHTLLFHDPVLPGTHNTKATTLMISARLIYVMEAEAILRYTSLKRFVITIPIFLTCIKNICKGLLRKFPLMVFRLMTCVITPVSQHVAANIVGSV